MSMIVYAYNGLEFLTWFAALVIMVQVICTEGWNGFANLYHQNETWRNVLWIA